MHDFLLAKQIVNEVQKIIEEKKLEDVKSVSVEIGMVKMAHDGHAEHAEEINLDNLRFGLESVSRATKLEGVKFDIQKTEGENWKILNIETT